MVAFEKYKNKIWGWGTPHFGGILGQISKVERKYLSPQGVLGDNFAIAGYAIHRST